jgi:3-demethoxyubiquinol 3-hydroxylase
MIPPDTYSNGVALSPRLSRADSVLSEAGRALQVLFGVARAGRPNPAGPLGADGATLSTTDQKHAAALMRVNHVGEVCAQALYRGQAIFCRDAATQNLFRRAASEEIDHLAWCRDRIGELRSHPSYLNPVWYAGSFSLGVMASYASRPKNLGFMAETESQVEQHLSRHLVQLPASDDRSRRIVEQMRDDEIVHRITAETHGAQLLPKPVRLIMRGMAKIMTTVAYRI